MRRLVQYIDWRWLRRLAAVLMVTMLASFVSSCETLPISGRRRMMPILSQEAEIQLGAEAYQQALQGVKISTNGALQERVRRVGMRLVEASGQTQFKWEFTVIDDDKTVNAWALPGGKVAVYTGILNLAGDDDALLATVMGHELAHATHRHGAERITENLGLQIITAGAQIVLDMQSYDPKTVEGVMAAFGVAGNVTMLKFSRAHESEADQVGLIYMARAGYHPAKAIEFWQKMSELAGDGGPPEFLSTHPSHETRVENLARWQEEAMEEFQGAQSKT